jgi:hypothetical protein
LEIEVVSRCQLFSCCLLSSVDTIKFVAVVVAWMLLLVPRDESKWWYAEFEGQK